MVNVLVVDDSAFYRVSLSQLINSNSNMRVVATAKDGESALQLTKQLNPDVIILDFNLAGIEGEKVVQNIMKHSPRPIIAFSKFTDLQMEKALTALESGLFDFIKKPELFDLSELQKIKEEIFTKIEAAAKTGNNLHSQNKILTKHIRPTKLEFGPTTKKILLVASSTGGPQTVERFLTELPGNIPCPILIVQHMPPVFTKSFADRLNKVCEVRVVEAKDNDEIVDGVAYIAPGNYHMTLAIKQGDNKQIINLNQNPQEEGVRPCANVLFRSVAPIYRENIVAVVLTGMGADGTKGGYEIKKYNGTIIAQSERTSIIYGMPKSIVDNGLADEVVDIDKMAVAVLQMIDA